MVSVIPALGGIFEPLLGCRCAREKSSFIPSSRYASVSVYPPGSVCKRMEIIIMLKNGTKVCVDPKANWVQHLVEIIRSMKKAASSS
ncbi:C-X-C motif chemokine 13-like isoform X2 [Rhineura floridana]|uniref:C-X-C motif chemokine 13-like isoform X2 n=1 Tax=Rhineura floridana TaxID=261503 RepID=UPI002AC82EB8|nr:C-X-C motif chemokine 13-like isoform X2 [Rhineura floridana]